MTEPTPAAGELWSDQDAFFAQFHDDDVIAAMSESDAMWIENMEASCRRKGCHLTDTEQNIVDRIATKYDLVPDDIPWQPWTEYLFGFARYPGWVRKTAADARRAR